MTPAACVIRSRSLGALAAILLASVGMMAPAVASAQPVALVGELHIGFSDDTNYVPGFPGANSALPKCAGLGPAVDT